MAKRNEHLFQFTGKQISDAAGREASYHANRVIFWKREHRLAIENAKEAGLEVSEGRVDDHLGVNAACHQVLQERITVCANKLHKHRKAADELQIEAACYGTQGDRTYELHPDDVIYFRLAGGPREE